MIESVVQGGSMGSTLPPGTRIAIDPRQREYVPQRVMAVLSGATLIAHRVVWRGLRESSRDYWILEGDSLAVVDPPIDADLVIGRVYVIAPDGLIDLPAPPARTFFKAAWRALARWIVCAALEIDVALARWLTRQLARLRAQPSSTE